MYCCRDCCQGGHRRGHRSRYSTGPRPWRRQRRRRGRACQRTRDDAGGRCLRRSRRNLPCARSWRPRSSSTKLTSWSSSSASRFTRRWALGLDLLDCVAPGCSGGTRPSARAGLVGGMQAYWISQAVCRVVLLPRSSGASITLRARCLTAAAAGAERGACWCVCAFPERLPTCHPQKSSESDSSEE